MGFLLHFCGKLFFTIGFLLNDFTTSLSHAHLRAPVVPGPVPPKSSSFSEEIIVFVSSKRRRLEARNVAFILILIPFPRYENTSFTDKEGHSFTKGFGARKFSGLF